MNYPRGLRRSLCGFAILAMVGSADAAIPRRPGQSISVAPATGISMADTHEALLLSMEERLQRLQDQGPQGYRNLVMIMFDENATMDARWKAVTAVGRIGGRDARPEILRALRSRTWYMRNAGLLAMRQIETRQALTWARRFLSDPALVVRASAVDVIGEFADRESIALLWKKIAAPENFRNGQSLFIRQRMAETLARIDGRLGREADFIRLLSDADPALHSPAIQALEKITQKSVSRNGAPLDERRAAWLQWWRDGKG